MSKKYTPKVTPEPIWSGDDVASQFDLIYAFQWYDQNKTYGDARQYLLSYLGPKLTQPQKAAGKILNESWDITTGWMARCLSRGVKVDDNTKFRFEVRAKNFIERLNIIVKEKNLDVPVVVQEDNKLSIQDRILAKTDVHIAELEGMFDEFYFHKTITEFDPYKWFVENDVKPIHANKIAEYFRDRAKDLIEVLEGRKKDAYLKESFPRSSKEMLGAIGFYTSIVTSAERLASNKLASRKPRKKKPVSLEKKIAKLNYLKEDTEFKLSSINPIKILSAEKLWVFNVKTRKLGVYIAADGAGLSVKGSKIENYKYSESIAKTLRKPKEVLTRVLDGGKVVLRKVMSEVNSKPQQLNGSINKDTILLRVE